MKVKLKAIKQKARKAPSSTSKKALAEYTPKNHKAPPSKKKVADDEAAQRLASRMPNAKKAKQTNKKVKKLADKFAIDPKLEKIIHANYMEYLKLCKPPQWGNGNLDPDSKGFDGYDSLRLLPFLSTDLKIKADRIEALFGDAPGPKLIAAIVKATIYNVWQWNNFCSRLWSETVGLEPPVRRVVNIDFTDLFPMAETPSYLAKLMTHLVADKDFTQGITNLGLARTKVRLLFNFKHSAKVQPKTLYKLFDLLKFPSSNNSIWGFTLDLKATDSYSEYPREIVILRPNNLRKSEAAEAYLDEAIDAGYRVILPFELVKGSNTSIKEIKGSPIYSKLCKSWKGLSPLMTMPDSSKMVKVAKVSKLSDILLV